MAFHHLTPHQLFLAHWVSWLGANRLAEAEPLMRRALIIFETSLGSEHPHTQIISRNLDILLAVLGSGT